MKLIDTKALATDVISHDVSPLTVNTDAGAYSKLGWLIIVFGVLGFLVWAVFAPLDKGVPLSGFVSKETNRKAVQHLSGGTIDQILVKEGEVVKAGQVLVRMNGVQANAQSDMSKSQYFSVRATEARLLAERDGKKTLTFPPTLEQYKADPRVTENVSLQSQLMVSRQLELQNELSAVEENVSGLRMQLIGLQESRDSKKEQLKILKEQLDNARDLAKEGYIARSKLLDLERTYAQINGAISEDVGNIGRAQRQIAEMGFKRSQRLQQFQKEVRATLADAQKEADSLESRLNAEKYTVQNIDVKSPVDGTIVGLNVFTKGGVVQPGARMMDVVPANDGLIVEGQLPINLVDRVHPGLKVELIFSAFNGNTTPHIPGEVMQVSADRLLDEKNGAPYYKVTARVSTKGAALLKEKKLDVRPGMPVELFVKTGERSMMSYLLKPIFDRAKTSMTEE